MRITVKTKQDRNSKESRYQRIFERRLKRLLLKHYANRAGNEELILDTIEGFEVLDPVLDWEYQNICGCEIGGFEYINHNIKQDRLFERNGHLLYRTPLSVVSKFSRVTDGYEMWLLEDMRIVFTYYVEMKVAYKDVSETMTYRYALGKRVPDGMYMRLESVLKAIDEQVYFARRPPDEDEE